ncbi:MAG: hypothetical protein ACK4FJ_18480 [Ferrovibrio sp.]|uniref:hypothetical protein n=1 Tax=Ferrovibrio sp. TaxID=1917215 RepID=UPI00391DC4AE
MRKLQLEASNEQVHDLFAALDKVRSTSRTVTVGKAALSALLRDHTKLLNHTKGDWE